MNQGGKIKEIEIKKELFWFLGCEIWKLFFDAKTIEDGGSVEELEYKNF